jgi:threonine/homoserine/homoserine lactone efflux protein
MTWQTLTAYMIVVTVACLTPGPVVLLVLSQAMAQGAGRTLWAIFGIVAANTLYFGLSTIGIGAILFTFHDLFFVLRWAGTTYLVWLGLKDVFGKPRNFMLTDARDVPSGAQMFSKGFILQVSNPASWLFFTAVLPPFVDAKTAILPQIAVLTAVGNAIEFLVASCYALAAARLSRLVTRPSVALLITRISGLLLIAAALTIALSQ